MASFLFLVRSRPVEGKEQAYDDWYNDRHVPDLLAVPGIRSARRYRVLSEEPEWAGTSVAIYEIEADDISTVMAETAARYGTDAMPRSDAMDSSRTFHVLATEIMPLRKA